MTVGRVETHQNTDFNPAALDPIIAQELQTPVTFLQFGGAFQSDLAAGPADALLFGLEGGARLGRQGRVRLRRAPLALGPRQLAAHLPGRGLLRRRRCRATSTARTSTSPTRRTRTRASTTSPSTARSTSTSILFRNLITTVTSSWYVKPSLRYRPTGRKTGGGDDTGFEVQVSAMYAQAWYATNTPSGQHTPLGIELNAGITYDTSDRFRAGVAYGLLIPFSGFRNEATGATPGIAHAARFILAIPF